MFRKGFTITEILMAMAVLSILAVVAVPMYKDYKVKGSVTNIMTTTKGVQNEISAHYIKTGKLLSKDNYEIKNKDLISEITVEEGLITVVGAETTFGKDGFKMVFKANTESGAVKFDCQVTGNIPAAVVPVNCEYQDEITLTATKCEEGEYLVKGICTPCTGGRAVENGNCICLEGVWNGDSCVACSKGEFYDDKSSSCQKEPTVKANTKEECERRNKKEGESFTWIDGSCFQCTDNKKFNKESNRCECPENTFGAKCEIKCENGTFFNEKQGICVDKCDVSKKSFYHKERDECVTCSTKITGGIENRRTWIGEPHYKCCPEKSVTVSKQGDCVCDENNDFYYSKGRDICLECKSGEEMYYSPSEDNCVPCKREENKFWDREEKICKCIDINNAYMNENKECVCKGKEGEVPSGKECLSCGTQIDNNGKCCGNAETVVNGVCTECIWGAASIDNNRKCCDLGYSVQNGFCTCINLADNGQCCAFLDTLRDGVCIPFQPPKFMSFEDLDLSGFSLDFDMKLDFSGVDFGFGNINFGGGLFGGSSGFGSIGSFGF